MTLADLKSKFPLAIAIVVALAVAFACGRFSRPAKVEEKSHQEITQKVNTNTDTTGTTTGIVEKAKKEQRHVARHQVVVVTKKPDGTEQKTITTDTTTDTGIEKNTTKQVEAQVEKKVEQQVETHVEEDHSKLTLTLQPNWHVSVLAGLKSDFPTDPGVIYGVEVEKRLLGPIYGGVWVMNLGSFQAPKLAGGVKASLSF